jgi:biopolymer transport protein ExbB
LRAVAGPVDRQRRAACAPGAVLKGFQSVRLKILLLALLLAPSLANAWWNDEWNFRKEITLDLTPAGGDIAATATDVPVLIRLSIANFQYFGDAKPDGTDFRFVAGDDKTPLKFHVERFDAANQMAFLWVKVPRLPGGTNTEKIFLYYGNKDAPAGTDAAGTYDANQLLALHFTEDSGNPQDATAYANHASASTAKPAAASLIGGGATFDGTGVITVPATASLRLVPAKGMTLSTWVRVDAEQADAYLLALQDGAKSLVIGINGLAPYVRVDDGAGGTAEVRTAPALVVGQWHHVAAAVSSNRLVLYVDGVELGSSPASPPEIAGALGIGGATAGGNALVGSVDEVQASAVSRPPEWIRAQARGQGAESTLVAYGADAQREGEDVSYFKETMKNVTIDGWVVIGILLIMFLLSAWVIVQKALQLSRIQKANRAFLKAFENNRGDFAALDHPDQGGESDQAIGDPAAMNARGPLAKNHPFTHSSLYRLYHHGIQEIRARIATSTVGAAAVAPNRLSPQAVESVKATMDSSMVRLTQALQSKMVLLTIAISGGPFLGLLGTVVGVMITFAAITASGDVNVNAIAPGIAAALAATVAGLAVAIPALFAYNWLNTKIKEINADMRVFVDEFVTRMAERYC